MVKRMISFLLFFFVLSLSNESVAAGAKLPMQNNWTYFDKNSNEVLRSYDSEFLPSSAWSIKNGCVHLESQGFGSDLMTKQKYEEFEMEFDWKLSRGGNSGILFAVQTSEVYSYMGGLEIQLLDDVHSPDGKNAITSLGALYGLYEPISEAKAKLKLRKMNSGHLVVTKGRAQFFVNDILIGDYSLLPKDIISKIKGSKFQNIPSFYKQRAGHVLIQDHGGKASFCNVRIRPL